MLPVRIRRGGGGRRERVRRSPEVLTGSFLGAENEGGGDPRARPCWAGVVEGRSTGEGWSDEGGFVSISFYVFFGVSL